MSEFFDSNYKLSDGIYSLHDKTKLILSFTFRFPKYETLHFITTIR